MTTYTLFISDLHLSENHPLTAELLFQFLNKEARTAEALYILGDFFEMWVGDDDKSAFHEKIKTALRAVTQAGMPIYFMHGNLDFLIGKHFAKETGMTLLKEPTIINLYGERILLLHGDSLCTLDVKHQKSRKIMHNRFYQKMVLWFVPLSIRRHYGNRFRSGSIERKSYLPDNIMDVSQEAVEEAMEAAGVKTLIHGHTHRPAIHETKLNRRIVLGAWHESGVYCRADSNGPQIRLLESQLDQK